MYEVVVVVIHDFRTRNLEEKKLQELRLQLLSWQKVASVPRFVSLEALSSPSGPATGDEWSVLMVVGQVRTVSSQMILAST
jgi:hypothetical protein